MVVKVGIDRVPRRVLFTAATDLNNHPLLLRLFTSNDEDDPGRLSVAGVSLELQFGTEVGGPFEGFEIDDSAASTAPAFSAVALSGLGKYLHS